MFDIEDDTPKPESTSTTTKDLSVIGQDNEVMSKMDTGQENVKKLDEGKMRENNTLNQRTNPVTKTVEPIEEQTRVSGKNFDETHELTKDIPTHNQLGEEDQEPGWKENLDTLPFLLTPEILNYNVHNCLVDSGAAVNVMPLDICKRIKGQLESTPREVTQLDRTGFKVVGEMKNVLIHLAANNKICQFIDIMVADIPRGYGLILNRDWSAILKGYFASDWSHLLLPLKGTPNPVKILREPYMKYTVTKLGEGNESANPTLGNYLTKFNLRHHPSKRASSMIDS